MTTINYWPDNIGEVTIITPATIMREAAAALGPKTKNVVTAVVTSSQNDRNFVYDLILIAPALTYRYQLITIHHEITLYPVTAIYDGNGGTQIATESELKAWLQEALSSAETVRIVQSLIAQSQK